METGTWQGTIYLNSLKHGLYPPFNSCLFLLSKASWFHASFLKWYLVLDYRDVSHNQISEIPEDFREWFELLDFTDNSLTSIPDRVMRYVQPSSRYFFDNNKITKLPKMHVDTMKVLSLSYNSIKEFPTSFSSLSYLFVVPSQCYLLCSCFMMFGTDGLITTN